MKTHFVIDVSTGLRPWQAAAIRGWLQSGPTIKMDFYSNKLGVPWLEQALHLPTANARILVSRNKREGWYVGWRPSLSDRRYGYSGPPRHRRHGNSS